MKTIVTTCFEAKLVKSKVFVNYKELLSNKSVEAFNDTCNLSNHSCSGILFI